MSMNSTHILLARTQPCSHTGLSGMLETGVSLCAQEEGSTSVSTYSFGPTYPSCLQQLYLGGHVTIVPVSVI